MTAASRGCSRLRLPRPRTFLGLISLTTGAELVSLALVFNKATGIYGFITLLTGYPPSALQVTSYVLSILVIAGLAFLVPHVRKQSPFENLALAWLYALDALVSIALTAAFATVWYLARSRDPGGTTAGAAASAAASAAAGRARDGDGGGGDASAAQGGDDTVAVVAPPQVGPNSGNPDTAASMALVVAFALVRVYFSFVVMSHARAVLQRYGYCGGKDEEGDEEGDENGNGDANGNGGRNRNGNGNAATEEMIASGTSPNPFAEGSAHGAGWKGRLGRIMVFVGRGYWLGGRREDEEWARDVGSKFQRTRRGRRRSEVPAV